MQELFKVDIFEKLRVMEEEKQRELVLRLTDPERVSIIRIEQEIAMEEILTRRGSFAPEPSFVDEEIIIVNLDPKLGNYIDKKLLEPRVRGYYCYVCDCTVDYSIPFVEHRKDSLHQDHLRIPAEMREALENRLKNKSTANKKPIESNTKLMINKVEENKIKIDVPVKENSSGKKRTFQQLINDKSDDELSENVEQINDPVFVAKRNK